MVIYDDLGYRIWKYMKSTSNEKTPLTIATPDIALLKDEMETDVSQHIQIHKIRNFISVILKNPTDQSKSSPQFYT